MHARTALSLVLLSVLLLGGCRDGTGPSVLDVRGDWSYTTSALSGGGYECGVAGMSLSISQTGDAISGTSSAGTLTCTGDATLVSIELEPKPISGTAERNTVSLQIGGPAWRHSASMGAGTLTGSVTMERQIEGEPVTLTGTFTARLEI